MIFFHLPYDIGTDDKIMHRYSVSPRGHPSRKIHESSTKRSKCGMQSTEWKEVGYKHLLPKKLQYRFFMVHYRILESIYTHHQFTIS